uniref:hypothetical protein n=1 Tax=Actinotalea sp. TaxID=1872145 RepID=UPI0035669367
DDDDSRPDALHAADVARLVVSAVKDYDTWTTVDTTFGGVAVTLFGARTAPEHAPDPRTLRSIAGYSCPCGARGWLQEGASDEDRAAFDAEVSTHDDCEVPA